MTTGVDAAAHTHAARVRAHRAPRVDERAAREVVAHGGDEQRRCAVGADETRDALGDVAADASGILAHDAGG